jgi:hypothetical protein
MTRIFITKYGECSTYTKFSLSLKLSRDKTPQMATVDTDNTGNFVNVDANFTSEEGIFQMDVLSREASLAICAELSRKLGQDCFVEYVELESSSNEPQPRSSLGILLNGFLIDDIAFGGPAFNTEEIDKGDTIIKVDDQDVTEDNIQSLLVGPDIPGTTVVVTVKKGCGANVRRGDNNPLWYLNSALSSKSPIPLPLQDRPGQLSMTRDVVLTRMKAGSVAERKRISELLTIMKVARHSAREHPRVASIIHVTCSYVTSEQQHPV